MIIDKHSLESRGGTFAAGDREPLHTHEWGQLKWPGRVAMVRTPAGMFVLPARMALWIPAGVWHGGVYPHAVHEASLYVHARHCSLLPRHCCAVAGSDALMSTIEACMVEEGPVASQQAGRALAVLNRECIDAGLRPVPIQLPTTCSVQSVLEALLAKPARNRTLREWARQIDMSPSTFQRAFHRDTGVSFGMWRTRARLLLALQRLAENADVASVANELGYGVSAFVQTFKKTLGTTPGKYFRGNPAQRQRRAGART